MKEISTTIAEMTLEEKAALVAGADMWRLKAVERLGIPTIMVANGPNGLQKQADETDFVGISQSKPATCFPTGSILTATWDRELAYAVGQAIGEECRQEEVGVLLGPGINIKRSPLGGRNFDYYSEDPYLAGEMSAGYIQGVQSQGVGVSLKHFAVASQETRRMTIDAVIDERTMREIYLAGFERAVRQAQPWTVMCSYNQLNGAFASEHPTLIGEILKGEWGFDGLVVTDWGAVNDRLAGLRAGVDLEMPGPAAANERKIISAVRAGVLDETALDRAVERILALIARAEEGRAQAFTCDMQAHHLLARRAAAEGTVLLKNERETLPILPGASIALIGRCAKEPRFQGGGSSLTNPTQVENLYDELCKLAGAERVYYAPGYPEKGAQADEALIQEALAAAARADVVVVCAASLDGEGLDRHDMQLPAGSNALIEQLVAAHPRVVVALFNGAPLEMPWAKAAPAILEAYLGGQAGAGAVAEILLGKVNPSGKLAESFPIKLEDNPSYPYFPGAPQTAEYREGIFVGYRFYDLMCQEVLFPFGHGLSYTKFEYRDLRLETNGEQVVRAACTVKNVGKAAGKEVVQVYVRDVEASVFRPVKELKGFAKVALQPGEEAAVSIELDPRAFAFYDPQCKDWVVEAGEFEILMGASSRDIRLTGIVTLPGAQMPAARADYPGLAEYFNYAQAAPVSQEAFEALLGRPAPANQPARKGSYTLNTPIGDMSDSFIGRMLFHMMSGQVKKMVKGSGEDNPLADLIEGMLKEMPMRSMLMMSNGALTHEMAEGLLLMINGRYGKGLATLLKRR